MFAQALSNRSNVDIERDPANIHNYSLTSLSDIIVPGVPKGFVMANNINLQSIQSAEMLYQNLKK